MALNPRQTVKTLWRTFTIAAALVASRSAGAQDVQQPYPARGPIDQYLMTLRPLPLLSVYTASKAAVNAFTESLALELRQFNVRVSLVIPGGRAPETRFGENARSRIQRLGGFPEAYAGLAQSVLARWEQESSAITRSLDVAEAVWRAVNDPSCPVRIAAGADAVALAG
jgi:NAD(P)-dependent dehydrogenase (short-subunit alcohol dehydrogenase family)